MRPVDTKKYSFFYYILNNEEYEKFFELLDKNLSPVYTAFVYALLKSLNYNVNELIKILNVGKDILPPLLYSQIISTIKESIIINALDKNSSLTVTEFVNTDRFKLAGIDRNTINRTIKKYGINNP